MSQTRAQKRAKHALDEVKAAAQRLSDPSKKKFRAYANSLPAMIQMNGLGQTAAFCRSKDDYKPLYDLLSSWLTGDEQPYKDFDDLLKGITTANMDRYQAAQAEALAYLDWVKRFAQAYVEVKPEDEKAEEAKEPEVPPQGGAS